MLDAYLVLHVIPNMKKDRIVIDTNVILSGLKSKNGSSYQLLRCIPEKKFTVVVSVPLVLEYELVLSKHKKQLDLTCDEVNDFLDYICAVSMHVRIFYLWRPILKNPYDDHILELAVSSSSKYIVTFNLKDFKEAASFGSNAVEPDSFLKKMRG